MGVTQLTFRSVRRGQSLEHSPLSFVSVGSGTARLLCRLSVVRLETTKSTASPSIQGRTHRNPHQNSTSHKRLNILRKERNEDKPDHRNQRPNHRNPIPIPLSNNTVNEQAQNLTNSSSILETALPRCSDLEFARLVLDAESPVEGRESEERGYERCVCSE